MNANLVLYIAPTATGKTLSPIGLSEGYRVIYVCAARHVGLALAKSAISIGKKLRLHLVALVLKMLDCIISQEVNMLKKMMENLLNIEMEIKKLIILLVIKLKL